MSPAVRTSDCPLPDDDMTELLKELRMPALEPLLAHLPKVRNERARNILDSHSKLMVV